MSGGLKFRYSATALIAAALLFCACAKKQPMQDGGRIKVVASGHAVYAIAREVLKDIADIKMLIQPGVEAHSFEPSPQNAVDISNADFFFYTSSVLEPWAVKISEGRAIALNYDLPDTKYVNDPHVWMSFNNAAVMANNMAGHVARKFPGWERRLAQNTADFTRELQMLDRMYKASLANCKRRTIYHIGHSAFGFIAYNYKIKFEPLIGALFEGEPSPKDMALMIKDIKSRNAPYIFSEEAISPRLAATVATETGAKILYLYTIEDITKKEFEEGLTYKQLMMKNLDSLKKGLECSIE